MNSGNKKEFLELITGLAECFDKKIGSAAIEFYWQAVKNMSISDFRATVNEVAKTAKFFPRPSELCGYATGRAWMELDDIANVEAAKVLNAIHRHGSYESVCFDDPVTQAVISQCFSGWPKMCLDLVESEEKWFLKDFAKLYASFAKAKIELRGRLAGQFEIENTANGFGFDQDVKYIGDIERAKHIENKADREAVSCDPPAKLIELSRGIG